MPNMSAANTRSNAKATANGAASTAAAKRTVNDAHADQGETTPKKQTVTRETAS